MNIEYINDHPLFNPILYQFHTLEIKSLEETILRWIWIGSTGGLITGQARVGKTTAIKYVIGNIVDRMKRPIPTHFLTIPTRDKKTILSTYRQLCLSAKLSIKKYEVTDNLSNDFLTYLLEKYKEYKCSQLVLFVDETQRLSVGQLDVFADLHDSLIEVNLNLIVIFISNSEGIANMLDTLSQPKHSHIYGRFFLDQVTFTGLSSRQQVQYCLKQYDTLCFPKNGPTYTEKFLPDAYANGWRLEDTTDFLWDSFKEISNDTSLKTWPMKFFVKSVNMLLIDWLPEVGVEQLSQELTNRCIVDSGVLAYGVSLNV